MCGWKDLAMRGPLAAAAVVAVLTVTGCSGESGGRRAAGPLPAAPTVPTASPTPTSSTAAPLSKEQAAKRYLAIVKPYNLRLERLEQAINRGQPVAMVRTLAGQVAVANQAHMWDLRATVWPVEVRALVRELVAESARAQAYWRRQAARATTRSALIQAVLKAVQHDGSDAAGSSVAGSTWEPTMSGPIPEQPGPGRCRRV
jgi:hypothetical protein